MNKRRMKFTLALASFLLISVGSGGYPSPANARARVAWRVSQFENVLGSSLELKFAVASDNEAARAEAAALAEIERLDHILSGYERQSEFNRWLSAPGRPAHVSPELFEALSLFD